MSFLKECGFAVQPSPSKMCFVANGQSCYILGIMKAPITLMDRTKLVEVLLVPEVHLDFMKAMCLVPDLRRDVWHFLDDPAIFSI